MARQKVETFDWVNVIVPEARTQLEIYLKREGPKLTLRSLYYILLSMGLVPGTEYGYKRLSSSRVEAKKAGTYPGPADIEKHGLKLKKKRQDEKEGARL